MEAVLGETSQLRAERLLKEITLLIVQFLDEEKYTETARRLESEAGFFFNMKYFEEGVLNGNWDEIERYLSGFIKLDDNPSSMRIFLEIRKQKYMEALDENDKSKALDLLKNELKVFSTSNKETLEHLALLLTSDDFREKDQSSDYLGIKSARGNLLMELKKLIEENSLLCCKLRAPNTEKSRLLTLMDHSLRWQHLLCKNPVLNPEDTLFEDKPSWKPNLPLPISAPTPAACIFLLENPPIASNLSISSGAFNHGAPTTDSRTGFMSYNPGIYFARISSEKRLTKNAPKVKLSRNVRTASSGHAKVPDVSDNLPKTVARTLSQGSLPMSMDFHPCVRTILLVGTIVGDLKLWDVGIQERLLLKNFMLWDVDSCSRTLQVAIARAPCVSVTRVKWSPDGTWFGVACSVHILQLYTYHGVDATRQHRQIDAHVGSVNDVAFVNPTKKNLSVITCGDDKLIKMWDALSGEKQFALEGSEASVFSICPLVKGGIQFVLSSSLDGKVKGWLYDYASPLFVWTAPWELFISIVSSADGTRIFSCGTSSRGESYLIEWTEVNGMASRMYKGLTNRSSRVAQFDVAESNILAAGDDFLIKFWDMDYTGILASTDAGGSLLKSSRVRFNKGGTLLAVTARDNGIKILANSKGLELLRPSENHVLRESRIIENLEPLMVEIATSASVAAPSIMEDVDENPSTSVAADTPMESAKAGSCIDVEAAIVHDGPEKVWNTKEIIKPGDCRCLRLATNLREAKVSRLVYMNSGRGMLALASNATLLLWKWPDNGMASTREKPFLCQTHHGQVTNETIGVNLENEVPCLALSKNDSYILSASERKIFFCTTSFKELTRLMPPQGASCLAFNPLDNNVVAVGMNDSTIILCNICESKAMSELRGHSKRITGLAFSQVLHVLVSSGADAQVFVWDLGCCAKPKRTMLQIPDRMTVATSQPGTRVQFHQDQTRFLVVHESQIAVYDATELNCLKQWVPQEFALPITDATFSCDGQLIYTSFLDASVCIFDAANFGMQCHISPSAYVPASISNANIYPLTIASHPHVPDQFALGMSDGEVLLFEPFESQGRWGCASAG